MAPSWTACVALAATARGFGPGAPRRAAVARPAAPVIEPVARIEVPEGGGPMRPRPDDIGWAAARATLAERFGYSDAQLQAYDAVAKEELVQGYEMMQLCRQFENACAQSYMQGMIRGFMHLDNGQESIPAFVADSIRQGDIKYSYYREHTHALASGVPPEKIMAELFAKDGGTCRGAGGSMHIFDVDTHFQGGWALVAEQLPYAAGAARSIVLDRELGRTVPRAAGGDDDRLAIVFVGEGGAQNGRLAECLNVAAKEKLPLLFLIIDNGRAINTFTPDVAQNSEVWRAGEHYGVPGVKVDGQAMADVLRTGRAVTDYIRETGGPAIMQVHTYRLMGHSPADPEHERGRKQEKAWAKEAADPLKIFEASGMLAEDELAAAKKAMGAVVKAAVQFAKDSPSPPATLAKELEYPDPADTDYNSRPAPDGAAEMAARTMDPAALAACEERIATLQGAPGLNIGDAINLAILEEMVRDPSTLIHAEDLQAGSSYDIPKLTQQTFGAMRAADEIIDEGHFIGKAIGEGLNGYRPIVELMNANFGIYGLAELSSAGNTYATTGGQFKMPMTVVGAGGTAPNQALGAEHSQPLHAYVMGIPGLKICTAATPDAAYGLMKSMIRDDGPGMLFLPVKLMKDEKLPIAVGTCAPLNKAALIYAADPAAVANGDAVTVLTYLHGVRESKLALAQIHANGHDIDLIELRSLKPLDLETIGASLKKTHKLIILDESTKSGGVGATVSALVAENLYDDLDAPVKRLCMDDAPVPYAASMEKAVVKRGEDLIAAVADMVNYKI